MLDGDTVTPRYGRAMPTQMSGPERETLRQLGQNVRSLNSQITAAEKQRNTLIRLLHAKGVSPAEMGRVVELDRTVIHRIIARHVDRPSTRL